MIPHFLKYVSGNWSRRRHRVKLDVFRRGGRQYETGCLQDLRFTRLRPLSRLRISLPKP